MVRVLQVVTHMNRGGLETMLMNYYRRIDRSQVQFDFLTHRPYQGDYGDEIESLGGVLYHLPVLNPFSRSYQNKLCRFFDEHPQYQVIHVHQDCLSSVLLKAAKKHGVRVRIAHSHCSSQDKDVKYPVKLLCRRSIPKYATSLLSCGEEAGRWMFRGAPFQILNNAIETLEYRFNPQKRAELRSALGVLEEELLVGHVGRFSPSKNHVFLVDIFDVLQKKMPAKLLLVGDGGLRCSIEEKVESLGLADKVIFTGLRSDVAHLLQAMDVFVFPSNYEGLPVTMVEAQAAGLPCLISDKVPIECKKTDLVQQIPLSAGAGEWADAVVSAAQTQRRDMTEEIKASGFDIAENAKRLQEYYQKAAAGENHLCLY